MVGGWIYIMANRYRGTIYTGVTADVCARVWQHKKGIGSKFTTEYGLKLLVYLEHHDRIDDAIVREKRIKKWRRAWKIDLIEKTNPDWTDLWDTINN
ncbi:MAG: excinuclease subunit [Sphingomonas bacterium]|nr:excinuclease subunit [Sphingomonas bacterium]